MIRTDQEIKRDLIDELYWDYRVDASDVKAKVSDGKVTLTGTVPSYSARGAAAAAAWGIDGVSEVTNLLTVRFPPTYVIPTDAEIKVRLTATGQWCIAETGTNDIYFCYRRGTNTFAVQLGQLS